MIQRAAVFILLLTASLFACARDVSVLRGLNNKKLKRHSGWQ